MKKIYLYILFLAGSISTATAQNIFSGGNSDGFSFQTEGFEIYSGGGANGFAVASVGALDAEVALPVGLLSFTAQAQGNKVLLQWQTATEINSDHFEVAHAADARTFSFLTSVPGHNNSQTAQDYQCIDPMPYAGINYYRLKQVDKDGHYQLSKVVAVNIDKTNSARDFLVSIYPNPASQRIYMNITSQRNVNSNIYLYNAEGKLVSSQYSQLKTGDNSIGWNISHLSPGVYYCKFDNTAIPVISFVKE